MKLANSMLSGLLEQGASPRFPLRVLLVSYFICFVVFYIPTVFFGPTGELSSPSDIPPAWYKIGSDLLGNIHRCQQLASTGHPDDIGFYFSPLWVRFFCFLGLFDAMILRWMCLIATLMAFIAGCALAPRYFGKSEGAPAASMFIMAAGFTSYGMRFELERAQWNAVTLCVCLIAIALAECRRRGARSLGLALFTLAIHMKLWPIFLAPMFIRNDYSWKASAKEVCIWVVINTALLLSMGGGFFMYYIGNVLRKGGDPNVWIGDHSLMAFSRQMEKLYGWPSFVGGLLFWFFLAAYVFSSATCIRRLKPADRHLLLAMCVLAGMLLPGTSNDYKLVLLTMVLAIVFGADAGQGGGCRRRYLGAFALLVISVFYHFTLYSCHFKTSWPLWLQVNTVNLLVIYLGVLTLVGLRFFNASQSRALHQ